VSLFEDAKFPALLASFPGKEEAPVMLVGHFDVVAPEPDSHQFEPRTEGDFLWGRGSADMKTVVATYLVWMKDTLRQGAPYPGVSLLLVGNEEVGEREAYGTPHVLASLNESLGYQPQLMIVGERTGEGGKEAMGKICTANRGLARLEIIASGKRGHTGVRGAQDDLTQRLFQVRDDLREIMNCHLTLSSKDGWQSQARFPFLEVGERGIYNITAGSGVIGLEIRPIPEDDLLTLLEEIQTYCRRANLETKLESAENGVVCDPDNPYLRLLVESVAEVSGSQPSLGRKLPGTSARFAPSGQAVIWGQSGLGPHAADERHYIPSIKPYYDALTALGSRLKGPR
jgi:succinyl-diaminopimelate desuccinylase